MIVKLKNLAVAFAQVHAALALTGDQIADDLRASLSSASGVYLPSDPSYAGETTPRWNLYNAPQYVVAVKPALAEDVQKIIQYVREKDVPFLTTGGGHGVTTTLGELQNGLEFDMGNFKTVEVNLTASTMTIGGSVRGADVAAALQIAGKEIPLGECDCIGFTGATLGGGIGPYSGLYGPMSDSVLSIEMITGTGKLLTVSAHEHSTLFWGMKGAGFNYGAVTSLTYTVYDATNGGRAMNADMIFPGRLNGSVWAVAQSFVGKQPKDLSISFSVGFDAVAGEIFIVGGFIYAGPQEEGTKLIQPFLDLHPTNVTISTVEWQKLPSTTLFGATAQGCNGAQINYVPYALNLYEIDVTNMIDVVNFMLDSMSAKPQVQTAVLVLVQYAPFGFQKYPDASSAYPNRDVVVYAQIDGFAFDASATAALNDWGQEMRDRLQLGSGRSDPAVYVHFANGDEGEVAWYGKRKLPILHALKTKWDPDGLFSFYNPVSVA